MEPMWWNPQLVCPACAVRLRPDEQTPTCVLCEREVDRRLDLLEVLNMRDQQHHLPESD